MLWVAACSYCAGTNNIHRYQYFWNPFQVSSHQSKTVAGAVLQFSAYFFIHINLYKCTPLKIVAIYIYVSSDSVSAFRWNISGYNKNFLNGNCKLLHFDGFLHNGVRRQYTNRVLSLETRAYVEGIVLYVRQTLRYNLGNPAWKRRKLDWLVPTDSTLWRHPKIFQTLKKWFYRDETSCKKGEEVQNHNFVISWLPFPSI